MAKGIYVGVNGVAQKVKKAYVGVGGVAKKVKKAYVGIGGVAKLIFNDSKKIVKVTPDPNSMSVPKTYHSMEVTGDYLIIVGGDDKAPDSTTGPANSQAVNTYNTELTRSVLSDASRRQFRLSASIGDYAIFAGGYAYGGNSYSDADIYSNLLVKTTRSPFLTTSRFASSAVTIDNYAIFGATRNSNVVNASNNELTVQTISSFNDASNYNPSAVAGNYAVFFAGGYSSSSVQNVYDKNLTHSTLEAISGCSSGSRPQNSSNSYNDNALFFTYHGGFVYYDSQLTIHKLSALYSYGQDFYGTQLGESFIICDTNGGSKQTYVYNNNFTATINESLNVNRRGVPRGRIIGKYALLPGGSNTASVSTTVSSTVEAYTEE